jgi:hypothetical protein
MKQSMIELCISLTIVLAITLSGAGTAAAQTNTAFGTGALPSPSSPNLNDSAFGFHAINAPTEGGSNTAIGASALANNTEGSSNTASGSSALANNTEGISNTATGSSALAKNTTGIFNTASGAAALLFNTTGSFNTASGEAALFENTSGSNNTASGRAALVNNTTGNSNTASGVNALVDNTTGSDNTASGRAALVNNTTGSNNIGLGFRAGFNLTTGNNNIEVGNEGVAGESGTIRIGTQGTQIKTFVGGIFGSMVTGDAVVVSNEGQLGIVMSSARYKRDIRDMGSSSDALMKLRPVTFRYRNDPSQQSQYGLVAEEVARVYPNLVSHDADGEVVSVHYHELVPMLLNEVQKQAEQIRSLNAKISQDQAQRASFEQRLSALEHSLAVRDHSQTLAAALGR